MARAQRHPCPSAPAARFPGCPDTSLEKYLDNLETALQELMDKGDAALVPSYRPAGLKQVVVGDRLHDPDWIAINVNQKAYLPAPADKIAGLVRIAVEGAKLSTAFSPDVKEYTVT